MASWSGRSSLLEDCSGLSLSDGAPLGWWVKVGSEQQPKGSHHGDQGIALDRSVPVINVTSGGAGEPVRGGER